MLSLLLALAIFVNDGFQTAKSDPLIIVIEPSKQGLNYSLNGRPLDPKRLSAEILRELQARRSGERPHAWVMVTEEVAIRHLYGMSVLLGNTIGVHPVRFFVFSRQTGAMSEVRLDEERWKLSFDGKLEKSNR